jgi:hypothetical protein
MYILIITGHLADKIFSSALPILRQLGAHGNTGNMIRSGDFSMLKVWVGLELRGLFQASIESVSINRFAPSDPSLTHNV